MLKIDFDKPSVEHAPLEQLLSNPAPCGRIDDVYFEEHPYGAPPSIYKWATKVKADQAKRTDSYRIYTRLRQAGIRAHGWI